MPAQIIDGKKIADKIKDEIVIKIQQLPDRPNLAIILVGERPDSKLYVSLKEREAKKCGIDTHLYKFDEAAAEEELLQCIDFINKDKLISGVLLQLPLPKHLDTGGIVNAIDVNKDVDGFHQENLKNIRENKPHITPPLAGVILEICKAIKYDLENKQVAILAHSDIFMQGIGNILQAKGAKILPCNYDKSSGDNLQDCAKQADILITAVGKKHYLTADYIKPGAVVIDIGIIKEDDPSHKGGAGTTFGDVDFESVKEVADFITPVPGGVGPITIACAFRNVLQLYKIARE